MAPDVDRAFVALPAELRPQLAELRALIFDVAGQDPQIGLLTETLKLREPAYRPAKPRTCSTIRIGQSRKTPGRVAVFFICTTGLVDEFRAPSPELVCEGNRAILIDPGAPIPPALRFCIARALTCHRDRRG